MGLDFQKHISGRGTRTPAHSPVVESVSILPDTFTFHMPCPFSFPNTGTKAGHSLRCIVVHPYQWNPSILLRWYLPAGAHFRYFTDISIKLCQEYGPVMAQVRRAARIPFGVLCLRGKSPSNTLTLLSSLLACQLERVTEPSLSTINHQIPSCKTAPVEGVRLMYLYCSMEFMLSTPKIT